MSAPALPQPALSVTTWMGFRACPTIARRQASKVPSLGLNEVSKCCTSGVWIDQDSKPSAADGGRLTSQMRWNSAWKCWYHRRSRRALRVNTGSGPGDR